MLKGVINDIHKYVYNKNISESCKYSIITIITFLSFLRGYTGNDLITNISTFIR
jgi:hypothetical protein